MALNSVIRHKFRFPWSYFLLRLRSAFFTEASFKETRHVLYLPVSVLIHEWLVFASSRRRVCTIGRCWCWWNRVGSQTPALLSDCGWAVRKYECKQLCLSCRNEDWRGGCKPTWFWDLCLLAPASRLPWKMRWFFCNLHDAERWPIWSHHPYPQEPYS